MKIEVKSGSRFGRLTVIDRDIGRIDYPHWRCVCDCGNQKSIYAGSLKRGVTQSCGCLSKEVLAARATKHGATKGGKFTPEYRSYKSMRERCLNPHHTYYRNYGGRGISVCERWLESFNNFLADMGQKPTPAHTIEREDSNLPYGPSNCRWATRTEQNRNTRVTRPVRRSDGQIYATCGAAAESVGVKDGHIRWACRSDKEVGGFLWSYSGQPRELEKNARDAA